MTPVLRLIVLGVPQTKGSAKAFVVQKTGFRPRAIVTNDNPKAKDWQARIAEAAARALETSALQPFTEGPVVIDAWFYFARPQKFLTKKFLGVDVPHVTRPDADKLLRCCKDALSRVVWRDDAQVIDAYAHKRYCAPDGMPRAEIAVRRVIGDQPRPIVHAATPLLFDERLYGTEE